MSLVGVPSDKIVGIWPHAFPLLKRSIEMTNGRLSYITVLGDLVNRDMQLWLAPNGAMVTQIVTYPTGLKALVLVLVGGEMNKWLHFLPEIEKWGKDKGCEVSEMPRGRKGWTKMLKDYNTMIFMEKRL